MELVFCSCNPGQDNLKSSLKSEMPCRYILHIHALNMLSDKDDEEGGGAKDGARSAGVKIRRRLRLSSLLQALHPSPSSPLAWPSQPCQHQNYHHKEDVLSSFHFYQQWHFYWQLKYSDPIHKATPVGPLGDQNCTGILVRHNRSSMILGI